MQAGYASATKNSDFRGRLFFLLLAFIVFRIGSHLPVPGIDPIALSSFFAEQKSGILGMFNVFSGGALSRFSVFALGIMPYISASIIVQLAGAVVPFLESLKKEGEHGRRKITQYTRYLTLFLAIVQAYGISIALQTQAGLVFNPGPFFQFVTTVSLVTGTMFLVWLGEQITERGLGNGISMLIFAGIVSGIPSAIVSVFELVRNGALLPLISLFAFVLVVAVTAFVVFVERGQRKNHIELCEKTKCISSL
jgi:preprotein translocase subunit SecY